MFLQKKLVVHVCWAAYFMSQISNRILIQFLMYKHT